MRWCVRQVSRCRSNHSRSSSKWVSIPLLPGTEQMSRAFKKVVHLLTRLLWPPKSFCWTDHRFSREVQLSGSYRIIVHFPSLSISFNGHIKTISLSIFTVAFPFLAYTNISFCVWRWKEQHFSWGLLYVAIIVWYWYIYVEILDFQVEWTKTKYSDGIKSSTTQPNNLCLCALQCSGCFPNSTLTQAQNANS